MLIKLYFLIPNDFIFGDKYSRFGINLKVDGCACTLSVPNAQVPMGINHMPWMVTFGYLKCYKTKSKSTSITQYWRGCKKQNHMHANEEIMMHEFTYD